MSLKGKAAAIGIGELKPVKEPGDLTALGLMARVAAEAIADAGLEKKDIDGFLVGGASLRAVEFVSIIRAASPATARR